VREAIVISYFAAAVSAVFDYLSIVN